MFKKIILFILFFFISASTISAKDRPQVIFINQVRGEECCSKGTLNNLEIQLNAFINNKISGFFAIRYDALLNNEYISLLKDKIKNYPEFIKPAILVEIIPRLAEDAKVRYNGTENSWFEAQTVFTIGYSKEDKKRLLDKLFETYKNTFSDYPTLSSSWMIDTYSLTYIQEKYGIIGHQITREQWGTDSYTLYGGPPHYPYPASKNWLFIPDFTNKNPVIILRQTVTDPLYNYGETKKAFTSQPNDYLFSGLNFEYFEKLVNQALFEQKITGFSLLGLENSMEERFQKEYVRQIEYIAQLKDKVDFPDLKTLNSYWSKIKKTSYLGKDLINKTNNAAEFETTDLYRIRKRYVDDRSFITDYRQYDKRLIDPYDDYIAQKQGFFIAPFLLDYSHSYNKDNIFPDTRNDLSISEAPKFEITKFNLNLFNKERAKNYPYYLPEPIEREIDTKKSKVIISIKKDINIKLINKDSFGHPVTIFAPIEIDIFPKVKEIKYERSLAENSFTFPNNHFFYQRIILTSDKKVIKTIYIFPRLFSFLKLVL